MPRKKRTLEWYKKELERLRRKDNRSLGLYHAGKKTETQHRKLARAVDAEQAAIRHEILLRGDLADHLLSCTITFQASEERYPASDGNHTLGHELQEQFPRGLNDSEIGQGFFYINTRFALGVVEWLKDRATDVQLNDSFGVTLK